VDHRCRIERQAKLEFPLEHGKTWKSMYDWINSGGQDGRMDISYKVSGTYDVVVVDGYGTWHNVTRGSSGTAVEKLWYAPAAKRVVKRTWVTRYANGVLDQNRLFEAAEVEVKP